ncbi:Crp/Fnr family transcriptional regulator [Parapedobacter koreensis]|uniref:cAMP-binding domain of CRP or a regulatory subunit of cAMP-dependent protein kinases n=1 Tax=Parapedobacter koreensis TaxID=332977 RepID=A0A1H7K030_9SPHI|nr:Crp/Fnr family transcriptional regulator [Parapedobacter koreensis]SEK80213.1 cAMP-binding domain of CRP or a regulatory subunit of cAMP-dependent protein kinases [Parapedobacter koreensis]
MQELRDYLNQYASTLISDEEFEVIRRHFTPKKIRKKQYLLQEGEIGKHMAFVVKGAMRKYYIDEKGTENIVDLYIENWWAGDRESFVMFTPSIYHIDAWEDCELLLISREDTLKLCSQCRAFNELLLKLDERNNIAAQKRITSSISFTAEKRYEDFVGSHPYFVQRFPQHIIASYLGITKDTLSRVRKKTRQK